MIRGIILDLDGTIYYGSKPVDGAANFVKTMRANERRCIFVTNRANRTPAEIVRHLEGHQIPCAEAEILTSAQATALYLKKGRVYFIGEKGLEDALKAAGHTITDDKPDYVVVSFDRTFNYDKLSKACNLIHNGAKFICTNPDKALRMETGLTPGTGAIVAAVQAGCGATPLCIGKPERLIIDMAIQQLVVPREQVICVGDNIDTDIPAGINAGIRTVLILTGISRREDAEKSPNHPTWIVNNYEELTSIILTH